MNVPLTAADLVRANRNILGAQNTVAEYKQENKDLREKVTNLGASLNATTTALNNATATVNTLSEANKKFNKTVEILLLNSLNDKYAILKDSVLDLNNVHRFQWAVFWIPLLGQAAVIGSAKIKEDPLIERIKAARTGWAIAKAKYELYKTCGELTTTDKRFQARFNTYPYLPAPLKSSSFEGYSQKYR